MGQPTGRRARWIVGLVVAFALFVAYSLRSVFGPLLFAVALAYILEPAVVRLVRFGWPRALAVSVVFVVAGVLALGLVTAFAAQGIALAAGLPEQLSEGVNNAAQALTELAGFLKLDDYADAEVLQKALAPAASVVRALVVGVVGWFETLASALLAAVYLFYLMLELPRLWQWILDHLPSHDRERTVRVLDDLHSGLSSFLRGRVLIALLKGAVTAVGLVLCGTNAAVFLGMGAGILSILPIIGPIIGFAAAALVTLAQGAPADLIWVLVAFVVAEVIEGFVLLPLVMTRGVSLHPLTVLFCVMFWSSLLGVFGALCAIPLTIALKIVLREYVMPSVEQLAA